MKIEVYQMYQDIAEIADKNNYSYDFDTKLITCNLKQRPRLVCSRRKNGLQMPETLNGISKEYNYDTKYLELKSLKYYTYLGVHVSAVPIHSKQVYHNYEVINFLHFTLNKVSLLRCVEMLCEQWPAAKILERYGVIK